MEKVHVVGGVIDQDYRGEIMIIIANRGSLDWNIETGDRCAQIIIHKIVHPVFTHTFELDSTQRTGRFGSTGVDTLVPGAKPPTAGASSARSARLMSSQWYEPGKRQAKWKV